MTGLVCGLLVVSILSGAMVASGQEAFSLSFEDPQEYPENPDADLRSLVSYVDGDCVVVELATYGNISDLPEYSYWVSNVYSNEPYSFSFSYSGGNGSFVFFDGSLDFYDPNSTVELTDIWEIADGTLSVRIPGQYAGSPDAFNLTASSSYFDSDDMGSFVCDYINEDESNYMAYDFDNAEPLGVPASITDSLADGESKVYSMDLSAECGVLITLNGSLGDMPSLTIYDSGENYITGTMSMTRDARMTFIPQQSGVYYLAIESWSVSGSYDLTTSYRGGSGEAYARATAGSVPWQAGDEWSMGGYISIEDLFDQMMEEAGMMGIAYSMLFSGLETDGGVADFLHVAYAGEENGQQRFDFRSRLYADITVNMTSVSGSESYIGDEQTGESTTTMYMNASGIADVDYTGSVWLGYYEAQDGTGYWGVEKEVVDLAGSLDAYTGMYDHTSMDGMDDFSYAYENWIYGTLDLDLAMENEPGIPFLPADGSALSVDKRSSTTYEGGMDVEIRYEFDYSGTDEYPIDPEDTNETLESDFNGSYAGYYGLGFDPATGIADMTPLMTDPFSFLMLALNYAYGYSGAEAPPVYPYWLDYGSSQAAFDPDAGFFTSFELPLNPLSGTAMSIGGEGAGDTTVESLGILGALSGLAMDDVSDSDAEAFFEDPAAYIEGQEGGTSDAALLAILIVAISASVVASVAIISHRKRPGPPQEPQAPAGQSAQPPAQ